jgi:HlyD family secretion protein
MRGSRAASSRSSRRRRNRCSRAWRSPAPTSTRSICARRSAASCRASRSRSASRSSAASGSAQIDSPGRNKLIAGVDEFYLGRVQIGQRADVETGGKTYRAKVTKIYPQVQNGQFQVDLQFVGAEPAKIQRGQTMQAKLTLGDPAPARLIPNGAFYNETGGNWIFVVTPDGGSRGQAHVRLGRRNTEFIEVLEGLDPGEKVLTSPYTGFADKDRLDSPN